VIDLGYLISIFSNYCRCRPLCHRHRRTHAPGDSAHGLGLPRASLLCLEFTFDSLLPSFTLFPSPFLALRVALIYDLVRVWSKPSWVFG
jgi:hypothetical protein